MPQTANARVDEQAEERKNIRKSCWRRHTHTLGRGYSARVWRTIDQAKQARSTNGSGPCERAPKRWLVRPLRGNAIRAQKNARDSPSVLGVSDGAIFYQVREKGALPTAATTRPLLKARVRARRQKNFTSAAGSHPARIRWPDRAHPCLCVANKTPESESEGGTLLSSQTCSTCKRLECGLSLRGQTR